MVQAKQQAQQEFMTTEEVSERLRVPLGTLAYWRHVGDVGPKWFKVGGRRVLYARADVDAFIAAAQGQAS